MNETEFPPEELHSLTRLFFPDLASLGMFTAVEDSDLPPIYRQLLAHRNHMTVTVEAFYRSLVDVEVLERRREADKYARKILLRSQATGQVVQFGIVQLDKNCLPATAFEEIVSESTPLGRVLINHNVLREIELGTLWRVEPGPELCQMFNLATPEITYGRTAVIHVNRLPAVELLEIVAPV